MSRTNKTKKNLENVWQQLDDVCGLLDQAFHNIGTMTNIPEETIYRIERIDVSAIVMLKNSVEALIQEKEWVVKNIEEKL